MAGANPTGGGGIGQAAGELLKEMKKAQSEMQPMEQRSGMNGSNASFQQAMQSQASQQASQQTAVSAQAGQAGGNSLRDQISRESKVRSKLDSTRIGGTEKAKESKLASMLENLINGQDKMKQIMDLALSGKQFSPTDLMAMQAGVYRFTQELDLTSKVVEKATGGIKQTLNTQV